MVRYFYLLLAVFFLHSTPVWAERIGVAVVHQGSIAMHGDAYQHDLARQALEKFYGDKITVTTIENLKPGDDGERVISSLARKGNAIIFIASPGLEATALETAKRYPDVYFEIVNSNGAGENISTFSGRFYEARYILGKVAARITKTKILGYVAPELNAATYSQLNAYLLGAQSVLPDVTLVVAFSGTAVDTTPEARAARAVIAQNADVLSFQTETPAVAQVAEQNGVMVFGNAADMAMFAPQTQVTSIVHDWSGYYIKRVGTVLESKWTPAHLWAGLRDGIVTLGPFAHIDDAVRNEAINLQQQMINENVQVFNGPVFDKSGKERLKKGETANDDILKKMDWFVKGNIKVLKQE